VPSVKAFPTPNPDDILYRVRVDSHVANFVLPEPGDAFAGHDPSGKLSGYRFVKPIVVDEDGRWLDLLWVRDRSGQEEYNFDLKYSGDSVDHPIVIRSYVVRRSLYTPLARGTPDNDYFGAELVEEEVAKTTGIPEIDSLYVAVHRTYEALPGPYLPDSLWDTDRGLVQLRRRAVVNTGQKATESATAKTTYKAREDSSYVSWEIQETWSTGEGTEGNPAFPVNVKDDYDELRGDVRITTTLVPMGNEEGSFVIAGDQRTKTTYVPYEGSSYLRKKIVEVWGGLYDDRKKVYRQVSPRPDVFKTITNSTSYSEIRVGQSTELAGLGGSPALGTEGIGVTEITIERVDATHIRVSWSVDTGTTTNVVITYEQGDDGERVTVTQTYGFRAGMYEESGFNVIDSKIQPLTGGKAVRTTRRKDFAELIGTDCHPTLCSTITTVQNTVPAGTTEDSIRGERQVKISPLDRWRSVRMITTRALPDPEIWQDSIAIAIPPLFLGLAVYGPSISAIYSSDFNAKVIATLRSTFYRPGDEPVYSGYSIRAVDISFLPAIQNTRKCLTNGQPIWYTTTYNGTTLIVPPTPLPISAPSSDEYLALASEGEPVLWDVNTATIEGGIKRVTEVLVKLPMPLY